MASCALSSTPPFLPIPLDPIVQLKREYYNVGTFIAI